ncbi:MAG TPA: lysophospholipase [Bacteroidales bacterium]|nr:lysophospholipase [Bacteroidales bacterium]
MEFSFRLSNGLMLRGKINSPGEDLKAGVILVHGLGEHIGRYDELVGKLSMVNIAFMAVDLPGHGKSDGKRGCISNFGPIHEMIDTLSAEFRKTFPGKPLFLYGHSLGGGMALEYLASTKSAFTGAVVTSPWVKLSFEPAKFKVALASVMKNILPSLVQPSGLVVNHISHDASVVEKYCRDPLVHDKISVSLFHSAMSAGNFILSNAGSISIPVLIMHGAGDMITSPAGSREVAAMSDKFHLKIWEGGYHELHNETFRDEVYRYITDWLTGHII